MDLPHTILIRGSGRESAHYSGAEKFEPAHVGCYELRACQLPAKGLFPSHEQNKTAILRLHSLLHHNFGGLRSKRREKDF